jgi:hypothetical protein
MRLSKFGIRVLLKTFITLLFIFFLVFYVFNKERRHNLFSYFSTRCLDYRQKDFSRRLNDRIVDYSTAAKLKGIQPSKDEKELKKRISEGKLVKVRSGSKYVIDGMTYSYPCITKESKFLLDEISRRFRDKVSQKGLRGVKFVVTSMTRKTDVMKNLRRNNNNASENSPHLYGNAFDITYKRFIVRKWILTNCDKKYLKEALAEVIAELRDEKKCWATYERGQSCFHVVSR